MLLTLSVVVVVVVAVVEERMFDVGLYSRPLLVVRSVRIVVVDFV